MQDAKPINLHPLPLPIPSPMISYIYFYDVIIAPFQSKEILRRNIFFSKINQVYDYIHPIAIPPSIIFPFME